MDSAMRGRSIRRFASGLVVLGALAGGIVWAGNGTSAFAHSGSPERNTRVVNFNDAATLAWSVQIPGGPRERLHGVTCRRTNGQSFACHGMTWNGKKSLVLATVSGDGASWSSR